MNNVTVVIPVYDDWDTLEKCISSLQRYLSDNDQVLLINDRGPDSDHLEEQILSVIEGYNNFRYEKNPENLGFVKTCNRAVYELDKTDNDILLLNSDTEVTEGFLEEMQGVLYITEKHGVVCPRSNCATIYTVPYLKDPSVELTPENSYKVYTRVRDKLPRYHVMPTGVGFAMLIKRDLIREFGLFDEIYSPGYNEENDFCMRINQYGYSTICADQAYVFHYESKSFGGRRQELEINHSTILGQKYPNYSGMVKLYQEYQIDPVDYFSDKIGNLCDKKKVLIDLYEVPSSHNGTAEYGLSILNSFYVKFNEKYDISVLINDAADRFHGVSEKYPRVYHPDNIQGTFDIAYTPSQIIHTVHMHIINRTCLKYVFCMQDIISLRCGYILAEDWERQTIFEDSIKYADGVVFISKFDENDTKAYFPGLFSDSVKKTKVIYHGMNPVNRDTTDIKEELPFQKYIILIGNHYKHKNLDRVIDVLDGGQRNYIIVGASFTGRVGNNIYGYRAGSLSDEFLEGVYINCEGILFPSLYEGFGLPILTALKYGKKILVNENELNKELMQAFDNKGAYIYTFHRIDEIENRIEEMLSNAPIAHGDIPECRNWQAAAEEIEGLLEEVINEPTDIRLLRERWKKYQYESRIHRCYLPGNPGMRGGIKGQLKLSIMKHPKLYNLLKHFKHVLKIRKAS